MLARLILALLLAAFALPGAATACHDARPAMTTMHHASPMPDKAVPVHACIGCIPPSEWLSARVTPRIAAVVPDVAGTVATLDLGPAAPPALPPPRAR